MKKLISCLWIMSLCAALSASYSCKSHKKATSLADAERAARMAREKEERMRKEEEERKRREEEERLKSQRGTKEKLENNFQKIASGNNTEQALNETLNYFASPEVPVLIIIHQEGQQKDYDKPTTIRKYLDYLKDQKKSPNAVNNIVYDDAGKIKEVELIKK